MTDKAKLEKQIEEMEAKLQEMREELSTKKKWEPGGGSWYITRYGCLTTASASSEYRSFGTERKTKEQAEKARDKMRVFNRLLAYVDEYAPDYEPAWNEQNTAKYYVYLNHEDKEWTWSSNSFMELAGIVYMPKHVAEDLCRKLNSGEVVL